MRSFQIHDKLGCIHPMPAINQEAVRGALRKAKERKTSVMAWDSKLKGFGLRAAPTGRVSWLVQKWQGGRQGRARRIVIGHHPPMELEAARREAGIKIGEHFQGVDLVSAKQEKRRAKLKELQSPRLEEVAKSYLKAKKNKRSQGYQKQLEAMFDNVFLPYFGKDKRINEITKADIKAHLDSKLHREKQGIARYHFSVLSTFFQWCCIQEYIASSPVETIAKPEALKPRNRALTKEEIKAFWLATGEMKYPWCPLYRLLLLTAQRREEVGCMEWKEIEGETWIIPPHKTKNGKEHIVSLSTQSLEVIKSIPKQESRYLFTRTLKTPTSGYSKAKLDLDALMPEGTPSWVVHDLRRTAKTGFASLGVPKEVSEKILNHVSNSSSDLEAIYNRYEYLEERKEALEKWGNYITELVGGRP
jgi:integrase